MRSNSQRIAKVQVYSETTLETPIGLFKFLGSLPNSPPSQKSCVAPTAQNLFPVAIQSSPLIYLPVTN